jgi:hypothetical protein
MLTDYTDPDTIRRLLGVSHMELEDETIQLPMHELLVEQALEALGSGYLPLYQTVAVIAPETRTADQRRYYEVIRLYSAASAAKSFIPALAMFSFKSLSDSKASVTRQDNAEKALQGHMDSLLSTMKVKAAALLESLAPGTAGSPAATPTFFTGFAAAVGLGFDPVVGA